MRNCYAVRELGSVTNNSNTSRSLEMEATKNRRGGPEESPGTVLDWNC